MLRDVDFTSIVFKLAVLILLIEVIGSAFFLPPGFFSRNEIWLCFLFFILLLPACCFGAARKKEETEETRKISLFAFQLFGLVQAGRGLVVVPSFVNLVLHGPMGPLTPIFIWQGILMLIALSLLFLSRWWNCAILRVGRFLRKY